MDVDSGGKVNLSDLFQFVSATHSPRWPLHFYSSNVIVIVITVIVIVITVIVAISIAIIIVITIFIVVIVIIVSKALSTMASPLLFIQRHRHSHQL